MFLVWSIVTKESRCISNENPTTVNNSISFIFVASCMHVTGATTIMWTAYSPKVLVTMCTQLGTDNLSATSRA